MEDIVIKLIVEKADFEVNLNIERPNIKISEIVSNLFKGEQGEQGLQGETGNGIVSVIKTSTDDLVDTYTILFSNGEKTTYTVTNGRIGADGKSAYQFALEGGYTGTEEEFAQLFNNIITNEDLKDYVTEEELNKKGFATESYVQENGGKIDTIKVNGTKQTITNKEVNIAVPTDNKDLINGANYITKDVSNLTNYTLASKTGSKLNISIDNTNYIMTLQLLNEKGTVIDTKTIDFPIESMVVNASYSNGIITLVLQNGTELPVNVSALVKGLVPDTRTINGKPLTSDITLTASDVNALAEDDVFEWAKQPLKPEYDYSEIKNTPNIPEGSTVDTELSTTSTNAVQNKVIATAVNDLSRTISTVNQNVQDFGKATNNNTLNKAEKDASNLSEENINAWKEKLNATLPIGFVIYSSCKQNNAGLHLADGSELAIGGTYDAFCQYVINNQADFPITDLATYQTELNTVGQCGKYVITDSYVKLPKITKQLESANSESEFGTSLGAGLPNITGDVYSQYFKSPTDKNYWTGALSLSTKISNTPSSGSSAGFSKMTFNASNSNSIYGNSETVQPQTTKYYCYIVVGTVTKTAIVVNIDNVATDLNNKADKDLGNITPLQSVKSTFSSYPMPSATYETLSYTRNTTANFTAPANGWYAIKGTTNTGSNAYSHCTFTNGAGMGLRIPQWSSTAHYASMFPARKGDTVEVITANLSALSWLRFYYAEGEV